MMRSSNPAMNPEIFVNNRTYGLNDAMTIQGTMNKCFFLFLLLLLSASWIWSKVIQPVSPVIDEFGLQQSFNFTPYLYGGAIGGFALAFITIFRIDWARFTAPGYALCEGLVLGGLSAVLEQTYPGIVIQAVALTFATFFCMLFIYQTRIIKVTERLMIGIVSATGAVCLVYFLSWILGFFGMGVPFIHGNGVLGIGFSLLVVGIAAFNLLLDFHIIEQGAAQGADKKMEWYGAFALMVTLIWLYIEILRLLSKLRSRR